MDILLHAIMKKGKAILFGGLLKLDKITPNAESYSLEEVCKMSMLSKRIEAYDKGLIQQGMQQGMQQSLQQGHYDTLVILLEDRFGRIPLSITQRLKQTSLDELIGLCRRVLHIKSINELFW